MGEAGELQRPLPIPTGAPQGNGKGELGVRAPSTDGLNAALVRLQRALEQRTRFAGPTEGEQ
jgi:hypothetical protein